MLNTKTANTPLSIVSVPNWNKLKELYSIGQEGKVVFTVFKDQKEKNMTPLIRPEWSWPKYLLS